MGSMDYCKVRSMECIEPVHSRIYNQEWIDLIQFELYELIKRPQR